MARVRRVSPTTIGIAGFLGAVLLCQPARPSEILSANVRPFFAVGPSFPVGFDDVSRGFGMGFGFEVEQSPRVSVLFRVELNYMSGELPNLYLNYPPTLTNELTATNWSLGARTYLARHGTARSGPISTAVSECAWWVTRSRGVGLSHSARGAARGGSRKASR